MKYEPIKKSIGRFFSGPLIMRKVLYLLLDMLLLRSWHVRRTLGRVARELPPGSSVLDAGAGFGQYTWRMSKMYPGWKITAVDLNDEHIKDCTRFFERSGLNGRVHFQRRDLTTLDEKEAYDLILSVDVMEHIEEDLLVFRNFYNSLNENGVLLISTPSDKGGSDVHSDTEESFIEEHVRDGYGIEEITGKLSEAGFRNIETSYTYGKPGSISWRLSMKYPVTLLGLSRIFYVLLPFYYLVFFPVCVILNFLDLYLPHRTGTGLLVTAIK